MFKFPLFRSHFWENVAQNRSKNFNIQKKRLKNPGNVKVVKVVKVSRVYWAKSAR